MQCVTIFAWVTTKPQIYYWKCTQRHLLKNDLNAVHFKGMLMKNIFLRSYTYHIFFFSIWFVPFKGLPQRITVFHYNLFSVSSTVSPTNCMSSLHASTYLLLAYLFAYTSCEVAPVHPFTSRGPHSTILLQQATTRLPVVGSSSPRIESLVAERGGVASPLTLKSKR